MDDHYRLAETICEPRPVQQPRPRILIGGSGERKTLKLVARYADACHLFAPDLSIVAHKLQVLERHCDDEDRDYGEIEKTIIGGGDPLAEPDAFIADMERYAELGITKVWLSPMVADPAAWVAEVSERFVPRLGEMGTH